MNKRVIIIGGGASGLFAAYTIKRLDARTEVQILEAEDLVGKKILVTGNGRCNIANRDLKEDKFYCKESSFIKDLIQQFGIEKLEERFREIGVMFTDKGGYLYPKTLQASTVRLALESACRLSGVTIECLACVRHISRDKHGFCVTTDEKNYVCDRLIVACGTNAGLKTHHTDDIMQSVRELQIEVNPYKPALCSLYLDKKNRINAEFLKKASGVRTTICVESAQRTFEGELQITDYGLSGIVIFQIAHLINEELKQGRECAICVDYLPGHEPDELSSFFQNQFGYEKKTLLDLFSQVLNNKLAQALLAMYHTTRKDTVQAHQKNVGEETIKDIILFMKHIKHIIQKTNDSLHSQVLSGGIEISELTHSMEHKDIPGLYFTGECVDVDGICGGYNLYFAWATGYVAGRSVADDKTISD